VIRQNIVLLVILFCLGNGRAVAQQRSALPRQQSADSRQAPPLPVGEAPTEEFDLFLAPNTQPKAVKPDRKPERKAPPKATQAQYELPTEEYSSEPIVSERFDLSSDGGVIVAPAVDPNLMLEQISSELNSTSGRELQELKAIKEGLEQLRVHNRSLRETAVRERNAAAAARRQANRSEQLAAEAKRSAEAANRVALQSISRISDLEKRVTDTNQPAPVEPPRQPAVSGEIQFADTLPDNPPQIAASEPYRTEPSESNEEPAVRHPPSQPVTDAAVDRQALADNLFGAKEYRLAMQVYGQLVDDPPEEANETWFKFQIAGCLRNLKEFEKASRYYRMVVGSQDELLAPTARWWLSTIQDEEEISQQLAQWTGYDQQQEAGIE
jgi:tetratricopeptide (TPR) repeat protein